jgi:hypothetical protein
MSHQQRAVPAPFDLARVRFLYAGSAFVPIVARSHRSVVVDHRIRRIRLRRRRLERDGIDHANGVAYHVCYRLPIRNPQEKGTTP